MRVLITGASGLLGAHLIAALHQEHHVIGIDRNPWWGDFEADLRMGDLAEPSFRDSVLAEARPDLLIHCAAMINVDACEDRPEEAYVQNGTLTRALARAAGPDCRIVYITTDGIFKGDRALSTEADLPCPRTVYGRSKLHGEWEVQLATERHLIVRTNFYGWSSGRKSTSGEWLYHALENREEITLFEDFFFTPLYVADLVDCLGSLIEGDHSGIFHVCGSERVSKLEFGMMMAEIAGLPRDAVRRGSIEDVPLKAPRPRDMSLDVGRFREATGITPPDCRAGLRRFIAARGEPLSARTGLRWADPAGK